MITMEKKKMNCNAVILLLVTIVLTSCGTKRVVPITGRTYRIGEGLYSDKKMLQNSQTYYYDKYIPQMGGDSHDKEKTAMVRRVAENLIRVTTEYMQNNGFANELKYYEWDVHLVPAPGQINATCMAGGKILVFEGILPITQNEAGLAALLGHEIGHAIAHHSAQRETQLAKKRIGQKIGALGLAILGEKMGASGDETKELIKSTTQLSNDVMEFFEKKYSRKHEHEADHIGMVLMALAGYDPHEAPKLWERMTRYTGDFTNRILSTHPSNAKRKRWLEQKWMHEAMSYYRQSGYGETSDVLRQKETIENDTKNNTMSNPTSSILERSDSQPITHIVARGETLKSIAQMYNVTEDRIRKANPNVGVVYTGMKLVIPR